MVACGAHGCTNRTETHPHLKYHLLPSESKKELREKWLSKIRREKIPKKISICDEHFEPECFERDLQVIIIHLLRYPFFSVKEKGYFFHFHYFSSSSIL